MLYEFEEPFVVDHSKFKQAFGEHATPLKGGDRRHGALVPQQAPAGDIRLAS